MKKFVVLLAGTALMSLTACATAPRFDFGTYDTALYVYSKKPDQMPVFEQSLKQAITRGTVSNHLAPGLHAELGYCYLRDGRKAEALSEFKAEMDSFPESKPFLSKMISQNEG